MIVKHNTPAWRQTKERNSQGAPVVKLVEPFDLQMGDPKSSVVKIHSPVGRKSDLTSVPRFFWRIIPPWGDYSFSAFAHDELYKSQKFTRYLADVIFYELLRDAKVSFWKRLAMFYALRLFGWYAWNQNRKKNR